MADIDAGTLSGIDDASASSDIENGLSAGTLAGVMDGFASATSPNGGVASADVWARDMLELVFSQPMRVEAALLDPASYTIDAETAGVAVRVEEVFSKRDPATGELKPSTTSVFFLVTEFTVGARYAITALTTLLTIVGITMKPGKTTARFYGRRTKIDDMMESRPSPYDMAPHARHRVIVEGALRELDLIGGTRNDDLP